MPETRQTQSPAPLIQAGQAIGNAQRSASLNGEAASSATARSSKVGSSYDGAAIRAAADRGRHQPSKSPDCCARTVTARKPPPEQLKLLGSFLASRRARLQPDGLGLPAGPRRTPGLRREEVAVLAGVSVSWYTWLEQGRDIQASAETLRRVAQVLRLDRAESEYLFALSAREFPQPGTDSQVSEGLRLLVEAMGPIPAYVRNARLDILAWNPAVADLFVDYARLAPHERNTLRLLFLYPHYRTLILDWEQMARGMLCTFRAARAKAQDKDPFDRLVEELSKGCQEFRDWWPDVDVRGFEEGRKRLQHPRLGRVAFTYVALVPEGHPDLSMTVYIPRPDIS